MLAHPLGTLDQGDLGTCTLMNSKTPGLQSVVPPEVFGLEAQDLVLKMHPTQ